MRTKIRIQSVTYVSTSVDINSDDGIMKIWHSRMRYICDREIYKVINQTKKWTETYVPYYISIKAFILEKKPQMPTKNSHRVLI